MVHCNASTSRSAVYILAYMLEYGPFSGSLSATVAHMKGKWDATWPCDRFVMQLIELEEELKRKKDNLKLIQHQTDQLYLNLFLTHI